MSELSVESFLDRETEVWEALVRGDAAADAQLLSEDFLGVYPTGFADRSAHASQLEHGPTVAEYALSEARLRVLSPDCVLLVYRADWRRHTTSGPGGPETTFISSLWCRAGDKWTNVFSQDTPAAPSPDA